MHAGKQTIVSWRCDALRRLPQKKAFLHATTSGHTCEPSRHVYVSFRTFSRIEISEMNNIVGYFQGVDPAACLVQDGRLVAYVEEERLVRVKHAVDMFPIRCIDFCLKKAGLRISDIDCFAYGWDAPRYSNGEMQAFYDRVNQLHPPDAGTLRWQRRNLGWFQESSLQNLVRKNILNFFGTEAPPIQYFPHHQSHAVTAFFLSPFEEALVFTVDGSGDGECASVWHGKGNKLDLLQQIEIPHSLGWFYSAMTEYLGFQAYDGEYKVMGLAAFGKPHEGFRRALAEVLHPGKQGWDYELELKYIHHGPHTWSDRFSDHLVELLGIPPRFGSTPLTPEYESLAFETQYALEIHALRLLRHFRETTGLRNLCMAGGVALNVKMNSHIHRTGLFDELFIFPVPSDSGTSIGAALGVYHKATGRRPGPLEHVFLGPSFSDAEIELQIRSCGLEYETCENISERTAELIAEGKVVGWCQGPLEGGPRALGGRSILADPRYPASRDRVNAAIKFREYWRPFCPSLTVESVARFCKKPAPAPFMILAFEATEEACQKVPATVHVDGTMRIQTVDRASNPSYHALLEALERKIGVPVVLNTSFNIKGEAMVSSPRDCLRTFFSTGIDALAMGSFLIKKPSSPLSLKPEEVIR
jgi:carbamoyltransferase